MAADWSDVELAAAVDAYRLMAQNEAEGVKYSKKAVYRELAERFGRTDKSFEFRMQNISAVLDELGMPWIDGLKPATNVGANVKPRLVAIIQGMSPPSATKRRKPTEPAPYKAKLPAIRNWLVLVARNKGKTTYGELMEIFDIDRFSLRHAMDNLGHQADDAGEPIITALIVGKRSGRCSEGLVKEFGVQDDEAERQRLYDHWSEKDPAQDVDNKAPLKARAARFASVAVRPEQAAFRRRVFEAYGGRCFITGCDVERALDAAHKKGRSWKLGHNQAKDGYLMRKDLHALYDCGLLEILEGKVRLHSDAVEHYAEFQEVEVS